MRTWRELLGAANNSADDRSMAGGVPVAASVSTVSGDAETKSYTVPLVALTSLFFIWGFITCLNDILIPHLKAIFHLNYFQAMFIQFAFFIAYAVMSIPSGGLTKRFGYKRSIVIGLATMATGCMLFYPAAAQRSYPIFLVALFVLASGITLLQVAANPFVAILGKPQTASSRLTLTQAFNALGTSIAPQFGSLLILATAVKSSADLAKLTPAELATYQAAEASSVQMPYLGLAVTLVVLAGAFALFKLPTVTAGDGDTGSASTTDRDSAWKYPRLVLGALAIFMYVGGEVSIGSFLVNFFALPDIAALEEADAAKYVSFYWMGAMVGRFFGTYTLRRFEPSRVLMVHSVLGAAFVAAAILLSGHVAMWAILAVGLCNSIMFPTIFTLAIDGLGRHTSQGSGILCTAIVGGALIPLVQGKLADAIGVQHAFVVPIICFAYIGWYGWRAPSLR
jgi:FHS family L-fucose permease-like MFS transporter